MVNQGGYLMRDRTKQRNFDFTCYPKTIEILDNLPKRNRVQYVSEAIEEKYDREYNGIDLLKKIIELEQRIKVLEERSGI